MSDIFGKQLQKLLDQETVSKQLDGLPDDGEDSDMPTYEEMLPVKYEEVESSVTISDPMAKDLETDYNFSRSNMYGLIGRTNAAIDLALKIAQMSENPRAIEVAANLLKTSADITKELIGLQKALTNKPKEVKGTPTENPDGQYTQINNYYNRDDSVVIDNELDDLPDD